MLAQSQGCVWLALSDTAAVSLHAAVRAEIDARGDTLRAAIWRHIVAAQAALQRGEPAEAAAELHGARGLIGPYEEADTAEDGHCAAMAAGAGAAGGHLGASARLHARLLGAHGRGAGRGDG